MNVTEMPAICGLALMRYSNSGEGGIRTRGPLSWTQHFQCCTINHSATSPENGRLLNYYSFLEEKPEAGGQ